MSGWGWFPYHVLMYDCESIDTTPLSLPRELLFTPKIIESHRSCIYHFSFQLSCSLFSGVVWSFNRFYGTHQYFHCRFLNSLIWSVPWNLSINWLLQYILRYFFVFSTKIYHQFSFQLGITLFLQQWRH